MSTSVIPLPQTPHALQMIPEPVGLPEVIAQAFTTAMNEVVNLIQSPLVAKRFATVALTQLRTNMELQRCTPISLIAVFVEAAEAGLDISGQNECHIIPYKSYDKAGRITTIEATMQLGYAGLMKLAMAHPDVLDVYADMVCDNDVWAYRGINRIPDHVYPEGFGERGKARGFYAVAELTQHRARCVQMSVAEIKAHAQRYSRNHDKKVWSQQTGGGFEGMALKTLLRKVCNPKLIPMSARVAELLYKMDVAEGLIVPEPDEEDSPETIASRQRESLKSLEEHIGDLCGDDVAKQVSGRVDPETARALGDVHIANAETPESIRQREEAYQAMLALHIQITAILDEQGVSEAKRKQWRQSQAKKYKHASFEDMTDEELRAVYTDLLAAAEQKAMEGVTTVPDPTPGPSPTPEPEPEPEPEQESKEEPAHAETCMHEEPELPMAIPPQGWREELRHLASNTLEVVEGSRDTKFADESVKVCEAIMRLCDNPAFTEEESKEQVTRLLQIGALVNEELGF